MTVAGAAPDLTIISSHRVPSSLTSRFARRENQHAARAPQHAQKVNPNADRSRLAACTGDFWGTPMPHQCNEC